MKALQVSSFAGQAEVQLLERPLPAVRPGYATIQMRAVGLCRTDLLVAKGKLAPGANLVLGHEGAGVVLEDAQGLFQPGARVALNPCLPGSEFLGLHIDGILQEVVQLPVEQLIAAGDLPFHIAAYVEPVAASMAVLKASFTREQQGLLMGDNRIAHLTYLILTSNGFKVDWVRDSVYSDEPNRYDYAIETLFEKSAIHSLLLALKPGGLLVVKSRQFFPTEITPSVMVEKELSLKAVNYGNFNDAMKWLTVHHELITPLMGARYPLQAWADAFKAAEDPQASKIFIEI